MSAAVALTPTNEPQMEKGGEAQGMNPCSMPMTKFIIWNTKGPNNPTFRQYCEKMVKEHKGALLVLLETKMEEHKISLRHSSLTNKSSQ